MYRQLTCCTIALALLATGSLHAQTSTPSALIGEFLDDYGSNHTITTELWFHHPAMRYLIIKRDTVNQFLIALNHPDNPSDSGKWTRIDWMRLENMAPWHWAFCLSAYQAESAEAAEAATIADRSHPKSGCNGFPFTRLRSKP